MANITINPGYLFLLVVVFTAGYLTGNTHYRLLRARFRTMRLKLTCAYLQLDALRAALAKYEAQAPDAVKTLEEEEECDL